MECYLLLRIILKAYLVLGSEALMMMMVMRALQAKEHDGVKYEEQEIPKSVTQTWKADNANSQHFSKVVCTTIGDWWSLWSFWNNGKWRKRDTIMQILALHAVNICRSLWKVIQGADKRWQRYNSIVFCETLLLVEAWYASPIATVLHCTCVLL